MNQIARALGWILLAKTYNVPILTNEEAQHQPTGFIEGYVDEGYADEP